MILHLKGANCAAYAVTECLGPYQGLTCIGDLYYCEMCDENHFEIGASHICYNQESFFEVHRDKSMDRAVPVS